MKNTKKIFSNIVIVLLCLLLVSLPFIPGRNNVSAGTDKDTSTDIVNPGDSNVGNSGSDVTPGVVTDIWHSALDDNGTLITLTENDIPADVPKASQSGTEVIIDDVFIDLENPDDPYYTDGNSHYNCYAFCLGEIGPHNTLSNYNQYPIGIFSNSKVQSANYSTLAYVNSILSDLTSQPTPSTGTDYLTDPEPLYKKNVYWTLEEPDVENLGSNERLFCFRIGFNRSGAFSDYHFMRYGQETKSWYHKIGGLQYIFKLKDGLTPWNAKNSLGESAWRVRVNPLQSNQEPVFLSTEYNGTLVYFRYTD